MDAYTNLRENGLCDEERNSDCVLTTTLRRFSSYRKYGEFEFTEYVTNDESFGEYIRPVCYANGNCRENEGYVSILFHGCEIELDFSYVEFKCTVAVIDAAGDKRFMQSFGYVSDESNSTCGLENPDPVFGLDRYLKRETLCSDPSELLPGDCLTIHAEVDYFVRSATGSSPCAIDRTFVEDGDKYYIRLDSSFGQELCKVCEFFRRASKTDMKEKKTRRVYLPNEEMKAFHLMAYILWGFEEIKIHSADDICELYVVADKYNIPTLIETCRQMVNSFLCRINDSNIVEHTIESIPMILQLAETHSDESLKESVAVYLENKKKFETNEYAFETHVKNKLNTDWSCEFEKFGYTEYFKLIKFESIEHDMEFYK